MNVEPATRRANFWLMIALVIFAVGFCVLILVWMRFRTEKKGGRVYPPPAVWVQPTGPGLPPVAFSALLPSFC